MISAGEGCLKSIPATLSVFQLFDYFQFKYQKEKVVLDKYALVEAGHTRTVYDWFQSFRPGTVKREFAECGLIVENFYSDAAGSSFSPEGRKLLLLRSYRCCRTNASSGRLSAAGGAGRGEREL